MKVRVCFGARYCQFGPHLLDVRWYRIFEDAHPFGASVVVVLVFRQCDMERRDALEFDLVTPKSSSLESAIGPHFDGSEFVSGGGIESGRY